MATVREIRVCGLRIHTSLSDACLDYLQYIAWGTDRPKIHFEITLANGEIKGITIRQEKDRVIAYGDFEGLPTMLNMHREERGNGRDRESPPKQKG